MDNLDTALEYAALGLHVFPIYEIRPDGRCACGKDCGRDAGKHPRFHKEDLTNGLHSATTDEAQIRAWWERWPNASIGIATGPSGLAVLDDDPAKGGRDTLAALQRQHGPLPATWQVVTGSDGDHFIYAAPAGGIKNSTEELGPGLDTRGRGGYIVAAPSTHKSGNRYRWREGHSPGDLPLAPAPPWLVEALAPAPAPRPVSARRVWDSPDHEQIRELLRHIDPQPGYHAWLRVLAAVHSVLPGPDGEALCDEWSPGDGRNTVARKFASFRRDGGLGNGKRATIATLVYLAKQGGWTPPDRGQFINHHELGRTATGEQDARPTAEPDPDLTPALEAAGARIAELEQQLAACQRARQQAEADLAGARSRIAALERQNHELTSKAQALERCLTYPDQTIGPAVYGMATQIKKEHERGHVITTEEGAQYVKCYTNVAAEIAGRDTSTVRRAKRTLKEQGELQAVQQEEKVVTFDPETRREKTLRTKIDYVRVAQPDNVLATVTELLPKVEPKKRHGGARERRVCEHCGEEAGTQTDTTTSSVTRCAECLTVIEERPARTETVYHDAEGRRVHPSGGFTFNITDEQDARPVDAATAAQVARQLRIETDAQVARRWSGDDEAEETLEQDARPKEPGECRHCGSAKLPGSDYCAQHHPDRWGDYAALRRYTPMEAADD
jgi:hypothetical protein